MKDKELRSLLEDAGIIIGRDSEFGKFYVPVCIGEKLDAIIKYLDLEFKRVPEKVIAVSKVAPQQNVESAKTNIQQPKVDNSEKAI
jgi:hypothetical protein